MLSVTMLSIFSLVIGVVSLIMCVTGGSFIAADLTGLVGSALTILCANNVRKQAQG